MTSDDKKSKKPKMPAIKEKALSVTDPLGRYMAEVKKYPLLSKEEEKRLALLFYDEGDQSAAEQLVTANLRFVVKIAAEYSKFGNKMIDLIQEGNMGLMHGVRQYNPYNGARLITYAVWWIRGYIQEYLMKQHSMVRVGTTANQRKLFYQLRKQKEELERLGFDAGVKKLSGQLGISEKEVSEMTQRMSGGDISLNKPINQDGTTTLIELQQDEYQSQADDQLGNKEEIQQLRESINSIKDQLNAREIELLNDRLLSDSPKTLKVIGDKYGVSREAVRQMEARLLKKIKAKLHEALDIDSGN